MAKPISQIIMMGDSLSDRGTFTRRKLFGLIPMSLITGMIWKSPHGRFTNGYTWSDLTGVMLSDQFLINHVKKKHHMTDDDVADAVANNDYRVKQEIENAYTLDNNEYITFGGREFIRSYCEGGLSSHDYSWKPSTSISRFIQRILLAHLDQKRQELLEDNAAHEESPYEKSRTMIIEWSGANDLLTMNKRASKKEVDLSVQARAKNIRHLIRAGYSEFVWFNLPDFSVTPRFQSIQGKKGIQERANASECIRYFNEQLQEAALRLEKLYPHCSVKIFDMHNVLTEVYNQPEKYHFDPEKRAIPYSTSEDFKINEDGTSPASGYMFWDEIHPTADLHAVVAQKFYDHFRPFYDFEEPDAHADHNPEIQIDEDSLLQAFRYRYQQKLEKDQHRFFGRFRRSNFDYQHANLQDIFRHALYEGGGRTKHVIAHLEWLDESGNIKLNVPVLREAFNGVKALTFASQCVE